MRHLPRSGPLRSAILVPCRPPLGYALRPRGAGQGLVHQRLLHRKGRGYRVVTDLTSGQRAGGASAVANVGSGFRFVPHESGGFPLSVR